MRKAVVGLLGLTLASGVGLGQGPAAVAAPDKTGDRTTEYRDELPNPQEDKRRELREQALKDVLGGRAKPEKRGASTVVRVGETPTASPTSNGRTAQTRRKRDQYVELAREKTDRIFVVLAEFGNARHRDYPDQDTDPDTPGPAVFDGPLHNAIPEPDRSVDNSTFWRPDFSRAYFERVYFGTGRGDESLRQYYERQSSGRYSVNGTVTD
jgi:immune inhibitor A